LRHNHSNNRIKVLEDIASSDTAHAETFTSEDRITRLITARLVAVAVPLSVHFDDEPSLKASEVNSDGSDWKLPSELQPARPSAQLLPQQNLWQAHLPTQRARALYLLDRCLEDTWGPSTALRAVPLPRKSGGG
jgi:hypothetical protein